MFEAFLKKGRVLYAIWRRKEEATIEIERRIRETCWQQGTTFFREVDENDHLT